MSINHPAELDAELQIQIFETDVYNESLPNDILDSVSGQVNYEAGQKQVPLPDACFLKLSAAANDAREVTIPLVKELSGDPTLGSTGDQRLREEDIITKDFVMQYTDISHATTNQSYGILARDKIPYGLFEKRVPLLGKYFKQYFGKMRRQMLLEGQSENLLEAPHFNAATLNPNWFVPNIDDEDQVPWDLDLTTFENNLVEAMLHAGLGAAAAINVRYEQRLEDWAFATKFIEPLDMEDGQQGYIHIIPLPQYTWLKHPVHERALGPTWRDITDLPKDMQMKYPSAVGMLGRLLLVPDMRYPTLTLGGTTSYSGGGGGTITCQYRGMGNADDGSSDPRDKSRTARQVGFLIGKKFGCEWMPEKFHWEWDFEQYDKYFGSGLFCSVGMKLVCWDRGAGSQDEGTYQHMGSIVTPFARPPREGYAA
jgi:hypothetical protein